MSRPPPANPARPSGPAPSTPSAPDCFANTPTASASTQNSPSTTGTTATPSCANAWKKIPPPPGPAQPYARNNPRRNRRNPPGGPVTLAQASRYIDRQKHGNQHPNYDATAPDHAGQHETVLPWLYARYQERLDQAQACDFNDLVLLPVRVLEQNAEIARSIREIFQHVLVDEYQDVNRNQAKLAQLVADPDPDHASIYVVGDPDQAIYGFQHADVGNILRFASVQHPAARRYHLNNNYRSVPAVINAANRLIRHNRQRIDRESTPARSDHADAAIRIRGYANPEAEAKALAQLIKEAHESTRQVPYGHWCVAYRANRQSRALEEALRAAGVPVKIQGAYEFFKRQEIVIAVSYLRLARNPADYAALERVMNTPRRSLGDAAKNRLGRYAVLKTAHRLDQAVRAAAWEPEAFAAAQEDQKPLSAAATRGCQQLSQALDQLTELGAQDAAPGIILEYVYRGGECDLENYARQMPAAGESRWDNLTELENLANAGDYGPGTLEQFLQRVQLDPPDAEAEQAEQDGDEPPDRVSISTLHQTKGPGIPPHGHRRRQQSGNARTRRPTTHRPGRRTPRVLRGLHPGQGPVSTCPGTARRPPGSCKNAESTQEPSNNHTTPQLNNPPSRPGKVDLLEGMLTVHQGKDNRGREVPLHPELAERLNQTFEWTDAGKSSKPIIPVNIRIAWNWVHIALLAAIEAGEIPEGTYCSTHTMRHSAARHWLNQGVSINQISVRLGHSNPAISGAGKEAMAKVI